MAWFKRNDRKVKVPEGLWIKCNHCGEILYKKEIERNLGTCMRCNYHFRITPQERVSMILDEGSFEEMDKEIEPTDPLHFKDQKRYVDRLKSNQKQAGSKEAIICGAGRISGIDVMLGVFNFGFMGGSMGSVVGEKIARLFERAIDRKTGVIIFSASGGARMQEGIFSLMQMAKTSAMIAEFKRYPYPYISVLTDPTTGGVTASFAMLGDIIIAEPRALIGFAGPRVIQQTIKQTLPAGFQTAEYLLEHGMIDIIVDRREMRDTLVTLLSMLSRSEIKSGELHTSP